MSETIIITGGKGFVGGYLATHLAQKRPGVNVIVWDLPQIDITKPETYAGALAELQPTWIIHLAGIAAVGASLERPNVVREVNLEGTRRLLQTVRKVSGVTKVLAASSADIYGSAAASSDQKPLVEMALLDARPQNPYGESKLAMERMIEADFNDLVIRVRPFPHIGPGQQRGFVTADFASQIAQIERGEQLPQLQVGNLEAIRDFTDVRDVVRAYGLLLEHGHVGEVYHVASGRGVSMQAMLDQLLGYSAVPITVMPDAARMRPADVPALVGDATKLRQATNWEPTIPLDRSLKEILDYWRRT